MTEETSHVVVTTDSKPEQATQACPHCAAGQPPIWQKHTREWVHRIWNGPRFSSCVCTITRKK